MRRTKKKVRRGGACSVSDSRFTVILADYDTNLCSNQIPNQKQLPNLTLYLPKLTAFCYNLPFERF